MTLLSVADYRRLTNDIQTDPLDVAVAVADATELVADGMRRGRLGLEQGTWTERLKVYRDQLSVFGWAGKVYPTVTPVTAVATPAGATVDPTGRAIVGVGGTVVWETVAGFGASSYVDVTYTGGWTAGNVPHRLRNLIAAVAHRLAQPGAAVAPADPGTPVLSRVGDVQVQYAPQPAPPPVAPGMLTAAEKAELAGFIRRRV